MTIDGIIAAIGLGLMIDAIIFLVKILKHNL